MTWQAVAGLETPKFLVASGTNAKFLKTGPCDLVCERAPEACDTCRKYFAPAAKKDEKVKKENEAADHANNDSDKDKKEKKDHDNKKDDKDERTRNDDDD